MCSEPTTCIAQLPALEVQLTLTLLVQMTAPTALSSDSSPTSPSWPSLPPTARPCTTRMTAMSSAANPWRAGVGKEDAAKTERTANDEAALRPPVRRAVVESDPVEGAVPIPSPALGPLEEG